jgi:transporter family-2 protein
MNPKLTRICKHFFGARSAPYEFTSKKCMAHMSFNTIFAILIAVFAGSLLPAQFATNSALANELNSTTLTGAISYSVGSLFLFVLLVSQRLKPDWLSARRGPLWAWLGGAVGSAYVVGSVILTRALGAALATTLVIASQIITAILLDHFGVLGLQKRRINLTRLLAVLLAFAALAIKFWGTL